jgi:hypothetical protein
MSRILTDEERDKAVGYLKGTFNETLLNWMWNCVESANKAQDTKTARLVREETLKEVIEFLDDCGFDVTREDFITKSISDFPTFLPSRQMDIIRAILASRDYIKTELAKLKKGEMPDSNNELVMECCGKPESQCKCERG